MTESMKVLSGKKFVKKIHELGSKIQYLRLHIDRQYYIECVKDVAKNTIYIPSFAMEDYLKRVCLHE